MTVPERRQSARTPLHEFAYINIEGNNGGSVLNVSEGGLCFHSIAPVERNGTIRFWFAEHNRRIEAAGKLAWTDETKKTGGVQFTALPAGAREQIRKWIRQSATPSSSNRPSVPASLPVFSSPVVGLETTTVFDSAAAPADVSRGAGVLRPGSGFSRGLATGLLLSAFVLAVLVFHDYRRELGESLIRLGERFAAKPQEQMQVQTPAPQAAVVAPAPQAATPAQPTPTPTLQAVTPPRQTEVVSAPRTPPPPPQTVSPAPLTVASTPRSVSAQPPASSTPRTEVVAPPPAQVLPAEKALPQPLVSPAATQQAKLVIPEPATATSTSGGAVPVASTRTATTTPLTPSTTSPLPAAATGGDSAPEKPGTTQVELAGGAEKGDVVPERFFEIGKFKDQSGAEKTTDELAQLGFHANLVQKGHLWMSSYRVLVGPYGDDERAETAHHTLLSRGFKPRPFEKGSRTLTFRSKLTVHGARLYDGDCVIRWESYISDATVKFEQDNYLVTTVAGKWVKRATKYRRDTYVYRRNVDGSRTLLEIQFAGMNRALVVG